MSDVPDSGHFVRCPVEPKVVERSSLFEHLVRLVADGANIPGDQWSVDLGLIVDAWGLTPGDESRRKVAAHVRDAAATLRAVRESVSA